MELEELESMELLDDEDGLDSLLDEDELELKDEDELLLELDREENEEKDELEELDELAELSELELM
jgi:hypothetical protein